MSNIIVNTKYETLIHIPKTEDKFKIQVVYFPYPEEFKEYEIKETDKNIFWKDRYSWLDYLDEKTK